MITLAIILFLLITAGFTLWDYSYWLKRKAINHNNRFWIRAIAFGPVGVWLGLLTAGNWSLGIPVALLMVAFVFQNLFDGIFNVLRGLPWFYPGSEDGKSDGKIENLLQKYPWLQAVKVGLAIIFITIYILLL